MAEGADVDDVGVGGVDDDLCDLAGGVEAEVLPGDAGVGGLVDAVSVGCVAAKISFAGAYVDDVRVGVCDSDGADGA